MDGLSDSTAAWLTAAAQQLAVDDLVARLDGFGASERDARAVDDAVRTLTSAKNQGSALAVLAAAAARHERESAPAAPLGCYVLADALLQLVVKPAEPGSGASGNNAALLLKLIATLSARSVASLAGDLRVLAESSSLTNKGARKKLVEMLGVIVRKYVIAGTSSAVGRGGDDGSELLASYVELLGAPSMDVACKNAVVQTAAAAVCAAPRSAQAAVVVRALEEAGPSLHRMQKTLRHSYMQAHATLQGAGVSSALENESLSSQLLEALVSHCTALDEESRAAAIKILSAMCLSSKTVSRLIALSPRSQECKAVLVTMIVTAGGLAPIALNGAGSARSADDGGLLSVLAACPRALLLHRVDALCARSVLSGSSAELAELAELELLMRCEAVALSTSAQAINAIKEIALIRLGSSDVREHALAVRLATHVVRVTSSRETGLSVARALYAHASSHFSRGDGQTTSRLAGALFWAALASSDGSAENAGQEEGRVAVAKAAGELAVSTAKEVISLIVELAAGGASADDHAHILRLRVNALESSAAVVCAAFEAIAHTLTLGINNRAAEDTAPQSGGGEEDYMSLEAERQEFEQAQLAVAFANLACACRVVSGALEAACADECETLVCRLATVRCVGAVLLAWAQATDDRFCEPALEKALAASAGGGGKGASSTTAERVAALGHVHALLAAGHELSTLGHHATEGLLYANLEPHSPRACRARATELLADLVEKQLSAPRVSRLADAVLDEDVQVAASASSLLAHTLAVHSSAPKALCKAVKDAVQGGEPYPAHWGPAELDSSLRKLLPHLEAIDQPGAIHQLSVDAVKATLASSSATERRRLVALLGVLPCSARSIAALRDGQEAAAQMCDADDEIFVYLDAHLSKCAGAAPNKRSTPEMRALLLDARALADDLRSSPDDPSRLSGGGGGKRATRQAHGDNDGQHAANAGQTDLLALDAQVAAVNALRR
ncbi:hypothetical protein T492DRAFT_842162 [Pavlovales sp. CCMP2436]|nr:hypothetical protein T492DRAFT_842162 [Pavlovales sp. CCMP2436]